jgi:hypothetical protein
MPDIRIEFIVLRVREFSLAFTGVHPSARCFQLLLYSSMILCISSGSQMPWRNGVGVERLRFEF